MPKWRRVKNPRQVITRRRYLRRGKLHIPDPDSSRNLTGTQAIQAARWWYDMRR